MVQSQAMVQLREREAALTALGSAVGAARSGRGAVALVTGEQGLGKTSLLRHFSSHLSDDTRVLWGTCDDLITPRPLGPFRDIASHCSPDVVAALTSGQPPHRLHSILLEDLAGRPTLLVIEDVHWADDATLDAVTIIGRRITDLPVLLVLTFRDEDVAPDHPLRTALDALQHTTALHLSLPPLSRAAVADLTRVAVADLTSAAEATLADPAEAGLTPADLAEAEAERIYEITAGNPFYVSEMVAALTPDALCLDRPRELPPSITTSVLARCARLDRRARELVELVSMSPGRMSTNVLAEMVPGWAVDAEEPERLHLLEVGPRDVGFRHELTRTAVYENLPAARRYHLHASILTALLNIDGDPANVVHHAEGAGSSDTIATYAPLAARQAAALQSHREALTHFRRAVVTADSLAGPERAALFEDYGRSAYQVGHVPEAFRATRRAEALYRKYGEMTDVGRCMNRQAHYHWVTGATEAAWEQARATVAMLQRGGATAELAMTYNQLADLAALAGRPDAALRYGDRAVSLAEQVGGVLPRWWAKITMGMAHMQRDGNDSARLIAAIEGARAAHAHDVVVIGLIALTITNLSWVRPHEAARAVRRGVEYAEGVQRDVLKDYLEAHRAWLRLRAGAWGEAERIIHRLRTRRPIAGTVTGLTADTVLAELAIRRGDDDAAARLTAVATRADRVGELYRIGPVLELQAEWALTRKQSWPLDAFRKVLHDDEPGSAGGPDSAGTGFGGAGFGGARLAGWCALIGNPVDTAVKAPAPHAAMARGDWAGAASEFGAVGWHYDQALLLSLQGDKGALQTAMEIARSLGATPLANYLTARMRAGGLAVPRGPAQSTRSNPGGLTTRQVEVLALVAAGLTNTEIAAELSISPRTTEHHVSDILTKLGVRTRRDATRRAADLGVGAT